MRRCQWCAWRQPGLIRANHSSPPPHLPHAPHRECAAETAKNVTEATSLGVDVLTLLVSADAVWDLSEDAAISRIAWLFFQFLYAFAVPGKGTWGSVGGAAAATTNIISTGDAPHEPVHAIIGYALVNHDIAVFPSSDISVKVAVERLAQVRRAPCVDRELPLPSLLLLHTHPFFPRSVHPRL